MLTVSRSRISASRRLSASVSVVFVAVAPVPAADAYGLTGWQKFDSLLAGLVGFHESEDGYIVSFPDTENTQALIKDYKARLRDLENNIWQY